MHSFRTVPGLPPTRGPSKGIARCMGWGAKRSMSHVTTESLFLLNSTSTPTFWLSVWIRIAIFFYLSIYVCMYVYRQWNESQESLSDLHNFFHVFNAHAKVIFEPCLVRIRVLWEGNATSREWMHLQQRSSTFDFKNTHSLNMLEMTYIECIYEYYRHVCMYVCMYVSNVCHCAITRGGSFG